MCVFVKVNIFTSLVFLFMLIPEEAEDVPEIMGLISSFFEVICMSPLVSIQQSVLYILQ